MTGRERLLMLSSLAAVCALVLTAAGVDAVWVRVMFGLPLVALLPGFGLVSALLPERDPGRLERFALAVGVSLSATVVLGLASAASPSGLGRPMWVFALAGTTLFSNAIAALRTPEASSAEPRPLVLPSAATFVLALTAATFVVLLLVYSTGPTMQPSGREIVELWAQPESGTSRQVVLVGAGNLVSPTSLFRLRVFQGDTVLTEQTLDLPPGSSISVPVRASAGTSKMTPVTAILTAVGGPAAERTVVVWPSASTTSTRAW